MEQDAHTLVFFAVFEQSDLKASSSSGVLVPIVREQAWPLCVNLLDCFIDLAAIASGTTELKLEGMGCVRVYF